MTPAGRAVPHVLDLRVPPEPVPLLLDSPHSGSRWPEDFRPVAPEPLIRATEDAHVDALFGAAPGHGAVLLRALFPRAYIDPNRSLDDLDPALLAEPWPMPLAPGAKTALGKGLIWRLVPPGEAVFDRGLSVAEVQARIEGYYRPYHASLASALGGLHARFGRVLHINCHSMKSISTALDPEGPGVRRPDFVLGDRDGTSCDPAITDRVRRFLASAGHSVAVNDPYKGVELVRAYSDPAAGRHSLQIEIRRDLYMDEQSRTPHEGFTPLRRTLGRLIATLARER
jgi:N-formylglutamate deformylase